MLNELQNKPMLVGCLVLDREPTTGQAFEFDIIGIFGSKGEDRLFMKEFLLYDKLDAARLTQRAFEDDVLGGNVFSNN